MPFPDAAAVTPEDETTQAPGPWVWMVRARVGAGSQAIQRAHRKGTLDAHIVGRDDGAGARIQNFCDVSGAVPEIILSGVPS